MSNKFHPKCKNCNHRGLLDEDLCAICYLKEKGEWSKKYSSERPKHMQFRKSKR